MRALRTASAVAIVATGLTAAGCSLLGNDKDSVFNLKVGDCMNVSDLGDEVGSIPTVPCTGEHEAEIYSSTDLPDGDYPGDDSVNASVEDYCTGSFQAFIGMSYEESAIGVSAIQPTSDSWGQGDRQLLCFVYEVDDSGDPAVRTGTLKGANR